MIAINHKAERDKDVSKIKKSRHPKKVIVAGPGTGKSFLFQELIKEKKEQGKTDFIAITFIGKLGDALADDLCGLAETFTMHGFARKFVIANCGEGWKYYPRIFDVIKEDLAREGISNFEIGDDNYKAKTLYYKAVGDADVVHYAVQICKKDNHKIPVHDLILVDEFQDFNAIESEFVDILSQKNELIIVGDDDQALYEFKGSSPAHIRNKYDNGNTDFESHTLRFCSRCTEVIIKYFHNIVTKYNLNKPTKNRIQKEYICYVPDKKKDSVVNPKINLIKNCPTGMMAYKIRSELKKIIAEQKIKDILIIGEGRSCKIILKNIAKQLRRYGFKYVEFNKFDGYLNLKQEIVDAYKFISKDVDSLLGWRILDNPSDEIIKGTHKKNAKIIKSILNSTPSKVKLIKNADIAELEASIEFAVVPDTKIRRKLLIEEIKNKNINLSRPLSNLNITVCNILNSKGLGADVVFVIGFDEGKFPVTATPADSETYQLLVALTRAKKRIYFINTKGKKVSSFIDCIDQTDLVIDRVN